MKNRFYVILLVVCALFDDFLSMYLPPDFKYQSISYIPHFCFCALLVLTYSRSWLDRVLIGALCGLWTDFFFHQSFPTYFILYAVLCYGGGLFYEYMEENTWIQMGILWILSLFVDLIPFMISSVCHLVEVSLKTWFIHFEISTILMNLVILSFMIYVFNVYDRYNTIQNMRMHNQEKKKYHKLKLTRK